MGHAIPAHNVKLKRAYEPAAEEDGARILVDRLWPRGVAKVDAGLEQWARDVAPSPKLRKWFAHDPHRWREFRRRYRAELAENAGALRALRRHARDGPITLIYAAADKAHNHAVVLRRALLGRPTP